MGIYILSHIYQARRPRGPVCGAPRRSARGQLTRISRAPPFRTPCVPPFRCAPYVPSLCPRRVAECGHPEREPRKNVGHIARA